VSSITTQKQILRKQILGLRRAFTGPKKSKSDKRMYQNVTHHQLFQNARTVCIYVSMIDEPDTKPIIDEMLTKSDKHVVIPKIEGGIINLYRINSYQDVEKGTLGILEPKKECERVDSANVDLFIVPGVAFGRDGTRIGMGKGYYDRLLYNITAPTVGLAYDFQMFDSVPTNENDKRIDLVIC
jgi:5-formyltetrahydrofolate cyclo-ligase